MPGTSPKSRTCRDKSPKGKRQHSVPDSLGSDPQKPNGERLQKVLAQAGVASRRRAEELITAGRVKVNGETVRVLGTKVNPSDQIEVDGRLLERGTASRYYVLNKPAGVITTARDEYGRPTVLGLVKGIPGRVYPVGRLDYDTAGLLLLTDDGELTYRLTHPRFGVAKTYIAGVHGPVPEAALARLRQGIELEDGKTAPARVRKLSGGPDGLELLEITIHEGRNRQVRRMCEAVGHPVVTLERVKFGPLGLDVPRGSYRPLSAQEILALRRAAGLNP